VPAKDLEPSLVKAIKDSEPDIATIAAEMLLRAGITKHFSAADAPALIRILRQSDDGVTPLVLKVVVPMGAGAAPALAAAIKTEDIRTAWRAAILLGQIGVPAAAVVPTVQESVDRFNNRTGAAGDTYRRILKETIAKLGGTAPDRPVKP
jgi:HEAT repeat protein